MQDADTVLVATDMVYFYSHRATLLCESSNHFGSLLLGMAGDQSMEVDVSQPMDASDMVASPVFINVDYAADILNVLLHAIYGFSVQSYKPSPATLRATVAALANFGFHIERFLAPHSELYMLYLQAAATEPFPMYALAAEYSLESLAVSVSTFTLSVSLSDMTDDLAGQMGPTYLRRLFCKSRGEALLSCSLFTRQSFISVGRTHSNDYCTLLRLLTQLHPSFLPPILVLQVWIVPRATSRLSLGFGHLRARPL